LPAGDPVEIAFLVASILDRLSIPYAVGGALASSVYGEPRSTEDVDVGVEIQSGAPTETLIVALQELFYVPNGLARQAVAKGTAFNIIHRDSLRKVDIFVAGADPLSRESLERRRRVMITSDPPRALDLATAEDTLLQKLLWYVKGGRVSDRQWRDILGILKVQGDRLDFSYLSRWADARGMRDLLEKARAEARTR
jgi:hypothetical protein